jgi:hypothetical protein
LSGTVTLDGKPAVGATMTLHYADGKTFQILVKDKGSFAAREAPVGTATVTFSSMGAFVPTGRNKEMVEKMMKNVATGSIQFGPAQSVPIPARYSSKDTSGLTWEITSGKNEKSFELTE